MRKKQITVVVLFVLFLSIFLILNPASADYLFSVPDAECRLEINQDGTMDIYYKYEFHNLGQKLDFIDIGTPNGYFQLNNVQVRIDGKQAEGIKVTDADYTISGLRYGITLEMGTQSIAAGKTAIVEVLITKLRNNLTPATAERVQYRTLLTAIPANQMDETPDSESLIPEIGTLSDERTPVPTLFEVLKAEEESQYENNSFTETGTVSEDPESLTPMVYETVEYRTEEFVGFRFSPNWFGSQYVKGTTDYTFTIVMPEGVRDGQAFYYDANNWPYSNIPESNIINNRVVYRWHSNKATITAQCSFGAKFIKSALTSYENIYITPTPRPTSTRNPDSSYTTHSYSSSYSKSFSFGDLISEIFDVICSKPMLACIALAGFLWIASRNKSDSSSSSSSSTSYSYTSSSSYSPPRVTTDGYGIKRGLTAVEAAVLLETDVDRIFTMILYGLCRKKVITVKSTDPFEIDVDETATYGLNTYEKDFLNAFECKTEEEKNRVLRNTIRRLVDSVSEKVRGYNARDTKAYYRKICTKAWDEVSNAGTPELKSEILGSEINWMMLDPVSTTKTEAFLGSDDSVLPSWWWRVDPTITEDDLMHRIPDQKEPSKEENRAEAAVIPSVSVPSNSLTDIHTEDPSRTPDVSAAVRRAYGIPESERLQPQPRPPVLPGSDLARNLTNALRGFAITFTSQNNGIGSSVVSEMPAFKTAANDIYVQNRRKEEQRIAKLQEEAERKWRLEQERARRNSRDDDDDDDDDDHWSSGSSSCDCDSCACACACDSCDCACAGGGR